MKKKKLKPVNKLLALPMDSFVVSNVPAKEQDYL
jgi:hypothetical protein